MTDTAAENPHAASAEYNRLWKDGGDQHVPVRHAGNGCYLGLLAFPFDSVYATAESHRRRVLTIPVLA